MEFLKKKKFHLDFVGSILEEVRKEEKEKNKKNKEGAKKTSFLKKILNSLFS